MWWRYKMEKVTFVRFSEQYVMPQIQKLLQDCWFRFYARSRYGYVGEWGRKILFCYLVLCDLKYYNYKKKKMKLIVWMFSTCLRHSATRLIEDLLFECPLNTASYMILPQCLKSNTLTSTLKCCIPFYHSCKICI